MKKTLLLVILLAPLYYGCTLLDIESTKTETVSSKDSEHRNYTKDLEARVTALEERLRKLEAADK